MSLSSSPPAETPSESVAPALSTRLIPFFLAIWAVLVAVLCIDSLRWRMMHDAPLMQYLAWLIRRGYRPYVDLFDMNMPGTYLINALVQAVFGERDLGFRAADLCWLALTCAAAGRLIWPVSRQAGVVAGLLLATTYLMGAPWETMQRDWLMLLPIYLGLAEALHPRARAWRSALGGVALGLAALIKPQAVLLVPLFAIVMGCRPDRSPRHIAALVAGSMLLPAIATGWLYTTGGLEPFVWSWTQYLGPLYGRLDGHGAELEGGFTTLWGTTVGLGKMLLSVRKAPVVLLCVAAWWVTRRNRALTPLDRLRATALAGLILYGLLHVVSANKLWAYHFWPAYGGALPLIAMLAVPAGEDRRLPRLLVFLLPLHGILTMAVLLAGPAERAERVARRLAAVDHLTATLKARAGPTDRIQVLDTTGGGVHAAYQARLEPGSRFIYDFHFFHHMDSPAVRRLRALLLVDLERVRPRFVVAWRVSWAGRLSFEDLEHFPVLVSLLRTQYRVIESQPEYRLWERAGP